MKRKGKANTQRHPRMIMIHANGQHGIRPARWRRRLPGGVLRETGAWVVHHVVGPMNLATLIVGPREHVVAVATGVEPNW